MRLLVEAGIIPPGGVTTARCGRRRDDWRLRRPVEGERGREPGQQPERRRNQDAITRPHSTVSRRRRPDG